MSPKPSVFCLSLLTALTIVLGGCSQPNLEPPTATTDVASTALSASPEATVIGTEDGALTTVQFEELVLVLSELDEQGRADRLGNEGFSLAEFRKRALEHYSETMPSIDWLTKEISGQGTQSALAKLASFGLFAEFQEGTGASSTELEGSAYALDAVELRAGEVVTVLIHGQHVKPAVATPKPSPKDSTPAQQPDQKTVKMRTFSVAISFPPEIQLNERPCGEIRIDYSVSSTPARAFILLKNLNGEELGYAVVNLFSEFKREWDSPKGAKFFKYCKSAWVNESGTRYPGLMSESAVFVELVEEGRGGSVATEKGRFSVRK